MSKATEKHCMNCTKLNFIVDNALCREKTRRENPSFSTLTDNKKNATGKKWTRSDGNIETLENYVKT